MNEFAPHRAIIWLYAEVHELKKNGECDGDVAYKFDRTPYFIDGENKHEAIRQLLKLITDVKQATAARR